MASMKDFALAYAAKGIKVFPAKGKLPLTEHGFKDASSDPETISAWWDAYPTANIGIPTGKINGGLYVIDHDSYKDPDAKTLEKWQERNGPFPETPIARTGRGGTHYFFIDLEEHRSATDVIPHVDIRGEGGYVIVPPSVSEDTGKRYEWVTRPLTEGHLSMPNKSVRALLGHQKPSQEKPAPVGLSTIPEGKRVTALISLIGRMVDIGIDPETIRMMIRKENELKCIPPLSDHDLEKQVFPALERGWIPQHSYVKASEQVFSALPKPVTFSEVFRNMPALKPELIEGVLRQGHKMLIAGPSKAGKSFLLMRLAVAFAEGYKWLGNRCKQGKVMYLNLEIEQSSFFHRMKAIYDHLGLDVGNHVENIIVWNLRGHILPLDELVPHIIAEAKANGCIAIIIDPLYKVMSGDENSNSDIARMVTQFDRIAQESGASVIYAHHFAKGFGGDRSAIDRAAGAGTFTRDADAIVTLTKLDIGDVDEKDDTAFRVEYILREFANKEEYPVRFVYPEHRYAPELIGADLETSYSHAQKRKRKAEEEKRETYGAQINAIVDQIKEPDGTFFWNRFKEAYEEEYGELSRSTLRRYLENSGYEPSTDNSKGRGNHGMWRKK